MTLRPLYDLKAIQEQQTYEEITTRVRPIQGLFCSGFLRNMLLVLANWNFASLVDARTLPVCRLSGHFLFLVRVNVLGAILKLKSVEFCLSFAQDGINPQRIG